MSKSAKQKFIQSIETTGQFLKKDKPTDKDVPFRNDMQKFNTYPKPKV